MADPAAFSTLDRDLLRAIYLHPGQSAGAYWSGCGVRLNEGQIRGRIRKWRASGILEPDQPVRLSAQGYEVAAKQLDEPPP